MVSLHACVDSDDLAPAELEQAEIIEVHGCGPGTIGNGEICIDPLEGGGEGGGGPTGGEGGPGGPGPGGGGGADPYPIPAPKDCTQEVSYETCVHCCDWNVEKVWGERCRRMPQRTKKQRKDRALCWEDAENRRRACQRECPPITTVAP
jgi:hypothetical protein